MLFCMFFYIFFFVCFVFLFFFKVFNNFVVIAFWVVVETQIPTTTTTTTPSNLIFSYRYCYCNLKEAKKPKTKKSFLNKNSYLRLVVRFTHKKNVSIVRVIGLSEIHRKLQYNSVHLYTYTHAEKNKHFTQNKKLTHMQLISFKFPKMLEILSITVVVEYLQFRFQKSFNCKFSHFKSTKIKLNKKSTQLTKCIFNFISVKKN